MTESKIGSMLSIAMAMGLLWVPVLTAEPPATAPPAGQAAKEQPAAKEKKAPTAGPKFKGIWQKPVNYREPAREFVAMEANGWKIEVEKQLVTENPDVAKKAVERVTANLTASLAVLPESSHAHLRKLKFFMMYGPKSAGGGRDNGSEYFQQRAPDCYKTLDPRWGNSIVFYSADNYLWQTDFWALKLPLHELAHAYHLGQWAEDRAEICQAYDNAMKRKLYTNVKSIDGKTIEKAYAIQNPLEYFAELSCMYFVGCDYAPRNREELQAYDPEGYAMIRELWGVKD